MKRWLPFVVPFVVVVAAGLGASILLSDVFEPTCDAYVDVTFADLTHDQPCVRLKGNAHYPMVVRQTTPGGWFTTEQTVFLFPMFAEGVTEDRAVEVLVRTTRAPEDLVSYEAMTVTGRIDRVDPHKVPYSVEIDIGKRTNYFFTDHMVVLEPDMVLTSDEEWAEP